MTIPRRDWLASTSAMLLAACTRPSQTATSSKSSPATARAGDAEIPALLQLASVPGMAIATVSGSEVTAEGFGVRRAGAEDKATGVTGDTVFEAASLSKPVFASIVMQLAAERVIDLTRPLGEYLTLPNPADERAKLITATHVLSHSSGWRNWRNGRDVPLTAEFAPGSRFSYSGEGYFFLQRVVEKLTGKGLLQLSHERVFKPLGMTRSSYLWTPDLDTTFASPHSNRGEPLDSSNVRMGKAFAGLTAEMGKPVGEWRTRTSRKRCPRSTRTCRSFPTS